MKSCDTLEKEYPFLTFYNLSKASLKANNYDCPLPPKMMLENNKICNEFDDFIFNINFGKSCQWVIVNMGEKG